MNHKRVGLIVNPVAGMGGRVGLKGSDGAETLRRARELGATPSAPGRAVEALKGLASVANQIELITYPEEMGEREARDAGFEPRVIGRIRAGQTTAEDTIRAGKEMTALELHLLLFAGGDGTARDLYKAVGLEIPVVGIPAGVKIHSGIYAINPIRAANLAEMYLRGQIRALKEVEVMDIDEEAFRSNRVSARLYGYLRVPYERAFIQGSKEGSIAHEEVTLEAIALDIIENMKDDTIYIVGPGTTTKSIATKLGFEKTLLGVDMILKMSLLASDVNEDRILNLIKDNNAEIIVTVIGGQGFVFGRGNQQISPKVIKQIGRENITIIATPQKLASLGGRSLLVDTGDPELDKELTGFYKVVTGYRRSTVYRVNSRI